MEPVGARELLKEVFICPDMTDVPLDGFEKLLKFRQQTLQFQPQTSEELYLRPRAG